mmetsp:Transcript_58953/g.120703  ORF Transcript_58953/g.120703 Transcript_58953/m.120703 type:complete len:286 (-) Transcript_58953:348-1205(-)
MLIMGSPISAVASRFAQRKLVSSARIRGWTRSRFGLLPLRSICLFILYVRKTVWIVRDAALRSCVRTSLRSIQSTMRCSRGSIFMRATTPLMINDTVTTPKHATIVEITLPILVCTTTSPYPTVVMVMMVSQRHESKLESWSTCGYGRSARRMRYDIENTSVPMSQRMALKLAMNSERMTNHVSSWIFPILAMTCAMSLPFRAISATRRGSSVTRRNMSATNMLSDVYTVGSLRCSRSGIPIVKCSSGNGCGSRMKKSQMNIHKCLVSYNEKKLNPAVNSTPWDL